MEHTKFRAASAELQAWANSLPDLVADYVQQSIDSLENGKHLPDTTPEEMAEVILRQIGKRIANLMASFDAVLESIDMPPRFADR